MLTFGSVQTTVPLRQSYHLSPEWKYPVYIFRLPVLHRVGHRAEFLCSNTPDSCSAVARFGLQANDRLIPHLGDELVTFPPIHHSSTIQFMLHNWDSYSIVKPAVSKYSESLLMRSWVRSFPTKDVRIKKHQTSSSSLTLSCRTSLKSDAL
jgi:hypothetical protein